MKLRIIPILATIVLSVCILFGGWYAYRIYAVNQPFNKIITQHEGVKDATFTVDRSDVNVQLDLQSGANLADIVKQIEQQGKDIIGNRKLNIDIKNHSSKSLDQLWEKTLFTVAQAMENKQYTEITAAMKQLEKGNQNVKADAQIDDTNIYISLIEGQHSKFVILPRIPQKIGVWSNA
ncbi:hypothetical protein J2Z32_003918 [Paenibacillus turicensis]|uniref:DUF541 domain-containing protein n=1 Tax=Paenibacillus turicensis TaxID=160487 RepID=A0ABS4FY25_9BACL|nr:hypothetical protein [Paenibacillus turicensis]MBP1907243.1 hypothetical protein [Paenibacillus turicensis]